MTRNEGVERDVVWKAALEQCGYKVDQIRQWVEEKQKDE